MYFDIFRKINAFAKVDLISEHILHQVKTVFLSAKLHNAFSRIVDTLVL